MNIASYIDHTLLKPTTTYIEIKKICEEALHYRFAAVCVPPPLTGKAAEFLAAADAVANDATGADAVRAKPTAGRTAPPSHGRVKIATVIGFPFGYSTLKAKLAETEQAVTGADELDVVINLIALSNGDWSYLENEMKEIAAIVKGHGKILKVIIESGILSVEEIIRCCELYGRIGIDFMKTSTGYAEKGASVETVRLMREHLPSSIQIKASGGIRSYTFARQLIDAGASRLGCSASVAIVREEEGLGKTASRNGPSTQQGY